MTFKLNEVQKGRVVLPCPSFTQGLVQVGLDCIQEVRGIDIMLIQLDTVVKKVKKLQISKKKSESNFPDFSLLRESAVFPTVMAQQKKKMTTCLNMT